MSQAVDLEAYFARIGYRGGRAATLETLRALHVLHTSAIPFENLNPFLRWPVLLDLPALQRKLIHSGRGGYCFEQNVLFKAVLESLGFQVQGLAARVLWNQPEDALTARGHMLLKVHLDQVEYLVDVGFGGQTQTGPLRLDTESPQATPHEDFRVVTIPGGYKLQSFVRGEWKSLYRFSLEEQFLVDYEVSNYYLSTNPASHFTQRLAIARPVPGARHGLFGNQLSIHPLDGDTERRTLSTLAELRAALRDVFGLQVPEGAEVDAALEKVCNP